MQRTPDEPPGSRSRSRPRGLEGKLQDDSEPQSVAPSRTPPLMTATPKPHNARKYYEFHEQNGHMTAECRELRKALHELPNKGQIDRFLKRGLRFLREECDTTRPEPRDEECSTEIAQLRGAQQVLTAYQSSQVTVPTVQFGGGEGPHFTSPHNDPLVVEMKVASAIVRRILIDMGSSVDIITWDCLKKLKYLGREIITKRSFPWYTSSWDSRDKR
ncbi:hypothetical protein Cgig2_020641 [Carnegiea gigantea]|uniref:Retrotransposon gag domain-containing protein n=1 Tax=Carnegiea gigantea TaxID=171969 RepID=A0A9Q1Q9I9_9CARY|nr:hypothetical protein Cgig2_020641 [Carnegiea gigantea]